MTNFKADCTINLHVSCQGEANGILRGKGERISWACSIVHYKRGRVVLAVKHAGQVPKAQAEREALLFGFQQTHRLLQEKVDVCANFPLQGVLPKQEELAAGRRETPSVESKGDDLLRAWEGFRLRRIAKMDPGEAELLRKEAARA